MNTVKMHEVHARCCEALGTLEPLFKPHCKLTLLMRNPKSDDGDMIVTTDDLGAIIKAIERLQETEAAGQKG